MCAVPATQRFYFFASSSSALVRASRFVSVSIAERSWRMEMFAVGGSVGLFFGSLLVG
jgi:hypothetical protein